MTPPPDATTDANGDCDVSNGGVVLRVDEETGDVVKLELVLLLLNGGILLFDLLLVFSEEEDALVVVDVVDALLSVDVPEFVLVRAELDCCCCCWLPPRR